MEFNVKIELSDDVIFYIKNVMFEDCYQKDYIYIVNYLCNIGILVSVGDKDLYLTDIGRKIIKQII